MVLYLLIILAVCVLILVITNVLTRVGNELGNSTYENFPDKYKMPKTKLLKLYIIYPKNFISKCSFALYVSQIFLCLSIICLIIINLFNLNLFPLEDIKLIATICGIYVAVCYVLFFGIDRILYFINKHKNKKQ